MARHSLRSRRTPTPGSPSPEEVAALRARMGLSQPQFAELLYCSRRAVEDWEQGLRRMPALTWEIANLLCHYPAVSRARRRFLARTPSLD